MKACRFGGRVGAPLAAVAIVLSLWLASPSGGRAFTVSSLVTRDCHERISLRAIESAGWPGGLQPPAPTRLEAAMVDDLPFRLDREHRDPWTAALLLGARYPDLRHYDPKDLPALAELAADPDDQAAHCLRTIGDEGPDGDRNALSACRAFIRDQVEAALGPGEAFTPAATERWRVWLTFRGAIEVPLSRFAFRVGLALHALQDSFSHSFRDPETAEVRHVLNYVALLRGGYDEAEDGHPHLSHLDRCESGAEARDRRIAWATEASTDLLDALASDEGGRAGRLERVDAVLDRWLSLTPGCSVDNEYCGAPELDETPPGCAVRAVGSSGRPAPFVPLLVFFAIVALRRRRRAIVGASVLALGLLLVPSVANAETDEAEERELEAAASDEDEASMLGREASADLVIEEGFRRRFGPHFALIGGVDNVVVGAAAGGRFEATPWLTLGLDLEYQAWVSLSTRDAERGVTNVALAFVFTYATFGRLEIRGRVALGFSVLLFDLVAADRGSIGPFAGLTPLGVALRVRSRLRVIFEPGGIYFSVPQVAGVPLVHRHHRFTLGVQLMY